jgi:1,4-dihydroxy-2-naphthoate octaprenyltransferase
MWVVFALATLAGVYLVFEAGWPVIVIGVAGILCAMAYTGGPFALGYHGLGDVATFLFFGPVAVIGAYYVQSETFEIEPTIASISMGAVVTAILVVNNLRDIETDRRAGKRTLGVVMGDRPTRVWYAALLVVAFVVAVGVPAFAYEPAWSWIALAPAPLAFVLARRVLGSTSGRALNPILKRTAQLALLMAIAFAIAVGLSRV